MKTTNASRNNHHPNQQKQSETNLRPATITLCLCTFTQAYLLISVFPYAGYMVIHLFRNKASNITPENAGTYAGILSSSFMVGRFIGSYPWGKCADVYGRKFVLKWSLIGSGISSLGFGFSNSFTMALIFRFVLGLVNSIIGTTKTVVSEISHLHDNDDYNDDTLPNENEQQQQQEENEEEKQERNKKREAKMMGLVVGMRGWGYLMAPAIGGLLSEPLQRFPHSSIMQYCSGDDNASSVCHWMLSQYPFVLPNIIGMILCFVAALAVCVYIEETLPLEQRRDGRLLFLDLGKYMWDRIKTCFSCCNCCIFGRKGKISGDKKQDADEYVNGESESLLPSQTTIVYSSAASIEGQDKTNGNSDIVSPISSNSIPPPTPPTMKSIWSRPKTRHHLESYGLFSFVVTCVDEAFPLYCISQTGGLGLSEQSIGSILSGAGLLFALFQYGVYSIVVSKFGLYQSLKIGCLVGTIPIVFIPLSIIWKGGGQQHGNNNYQGLKSDLDQGVENQHDSSLNWKIYIFLVLIMSTSKIFCCLFFASISVAMNQSVPISSRGTMNGIATLMGSMGKGLGPMFSGWLVAFCISSGVGGLSPKVGSVLIFVVICVLGLLVYFGLDERSNGDEMDEEVEETREMKKEPKRN